MMIYPKTLMTFPISESDLGNIDYSWAMHDICTLSKRMKAESFQVIHFEYVKESDDIVGLRINALQPVSLEIKIYVYLHSTIFLFRRLMNRIKYIIGWWDITVSRLYCKRVRTVCKPFGKPGIEITKVVFLVPWLGLIERLLTDTNGNVVVKNEDVVFEWLWIMPWTLYRVEL